MGKKRRKSTSRKRKQAKSTLWNLLQPLQLKIIATVVFVLVALPLFWVFIQQQDTNAQYVLTLALVSLIIFIWALPDVKLALTAVFLFTQPLLIYLGNTEYGYTKAVFSLGFISLLLVVQVGEMALKGRANFQLTSLFPPVIFLLAASSLSLINSQTLLGDFQYMVLLIYFSLFYLFLSNVLERPHQIHFLIGTLLASAALASLYGLLQYYGVLLGAPGQEAGTGAIISTFGNKNYLGGFLAYLLVPGLALLLGSSQRWAKAYALGTLGLIYVTLVAVRSESAWLAVLLSLLVLFGGLFFTRSLELLRVNARWLLGLMGLMIVLTLGLLAGTVHWLWKESPSLSSLAQSAQRFSALGWLVPIAILGMPLLAWIIRLWKSRRGWAWVSLASLMMAIAAFSISPVGRGLYQGLWQLKERSASVRAEDWWIGYEMFKSHPLMGTGLGDYKREFLLQKAQFLQTERGRYYNSKVGYIVRAAQAHNEYVQIMAEMGVFGLLATASLIFMIFQSAWHRLIKSESYAGRILVAALFAGVVAFMSDSLFSFPLHLPANALVLIFLLGTLQSRALGEMRFVVSLGPETSRVLAGLVFLVAFVVSFFAYRDWLSDLYLDLGYRQFRSGEVAAAKESLERSVRLDFAPADALYWLGLIYAKEGDLARSLESFERCLPSFATEGTYYQLARVHLQFVQSAQGSKIEHLEQAKSYLETLFAIDPDPSLKSDALYLKGLILWEEGKPDEAQALLEDLFQRYPDKEELPVALAQIHLQQRLPFKARETFEQALKIIDQKLARLQQLLAPGSEVALDDYYTWKSDQKRLEELKAKVEEALRRLPK